MAQIPDELYKAMNDQIQREFASAYLYLSMAAYCESINFKGSASWLRLQWEEEQAHAIKLLDYLGDRGNRLVLQAIEQPKSTFKSLLDVFETVLAHEQKVSEQINEIYALSLKVNDFASQTFLQWFVNEQVEEESTSSEIVETLKLAGDRGSALLMVDRQLGGRSAGDTAE